jgi:hypothetical protein
METSENVTRKRRYHDFLYGPKIVCINIILKIMLLHVYL